MHLGREIMIPIRDVIAICPLLPPGKAKDNDAFLQTAQEEGFLTDVAGGKPHSFVVTAEGVYLSSISSTTLAKRADKLRSQIPI
ncbi:MAG: extracellular matrix regulator RemB [Limnochordia bacterium]